MKAKGTISVERWDEVKLGEAINNMLIARAWLFITRWEKSMESLMLNTFFTIQTMIMLINITPRQLIWDI